MVWQKAIFIVLVVFCLSPLGSAPLALALGLVIALSIGTPFPALSGKPTKYLLQTSVVLLGFGMDLKSVYQAGKDGILFTIATIFGTLVLGYLVGNLLSVKAKTSTLISSGTAICGGSAIAAVGPAIHAEADEMSVSLGTVFVLNSIALFLFPIIGHALNLTQNQFGVWDVHGLIWEWTEDFNSAFVTGESRGDSALEKSMFCGSGAVGSTNPSDYAAFMRFGFRSSLKGNYTVGNLGFRCVKEK